MLIRSCLAAIDFNESVNRPQKTSVEGKDLFREKVDRSGQNRTVVAVRVPKDTSWKISILDRCVECLSTGQIPNPQVNYLHRYTCIILSNFSTQYKRT